MLYHCIVTISFSVEFKFSVYWLRLPLTQSSIVFSSSYYSYYFIYFSSDYCNTDAGDNSGNDDYNHLFFIIFNCFHTLTNLFLLL